MAAFIQLGLPSKNIPMGAAKLKNDTKVGVSTAKTTTAANLSKQISAIAINSTI